MTVALTLRLTNDDHELLKILTVVERKSANQLIIELLHARFDQLMPGKRRRPQGSASELLRKALGIDVDAIAKDVAEEALDDLRRAEEHADTLRGGMHRPGGQDPDNGHMKSHIDVPTNTPSLDLATRGPQEAKQSSTEPGRRPGRAA